MLLLDENLSWRIIRDLESCYPECKHVSLTELPLPTKDIEIWKFAKKHELIIVTIDEDFMRLLMQYGFPPKVVLLKIGNQPRNEIVKTLVSHLNEIMELKKSDAIGVLEIYSITPSPSNPSGS